MKTLLVKCTGTTKAPGKLPKPEVEKFRRERINNSLENLRMMLLHRPEHQGLAGRRVEKAEILEHTVTFLKCQDGTKRRDGNMEQEFQDGYSTCLRKAADFLRTYSSQTAVQSSSAQAQRRVAPAVHLASHLQKLTATAAAAKRTTTHRSSGHEMATTAGCLSQRGQPGLMAAPQRQTVPFGQDGGAHRHSSLELHSLTWSSGQDGGMHNIHSSPGVHLKMLSILPKPQLSPTAHSAGPASLSVISISNSSCSSQALWRPWP